MNGNMYTHDLIFNIKNQKLIKKVCDLLIHLNRYVHGWSTDVIEALVYLDNSWVVVYR